ncbi:MAG: hypothetical protein ACK6DB_13635, partial [Planctomycetota bacterium]
ECARPLQRLRHQTRPGDSRGCDDRELLWSRSAEMQAMSGLLIAGRQRTSREAGGRSRSMGQVEKQGARTATGLRLDYRFTRS